MPTFDLKLDNHPAVQRHPLNGAKPFLDDKGTPVPLLPDHRCIRFEGTMIGYVFPNGKVSFIRPENQLGRPLIEAAVALVEREFKPVQQVQAVAPLIIQDDADEGGDE